MIDKKMSDEQIIKALECCIKSVSLNDCEDLQCPACDENGCFFMRKSTEYYPESLIQEMGKAVLEVLKQKDAEIEGIARLKVELHKKYLEQKAEIERLKEELDGETVKNMRLGHEVERLMKEQLEKELFEGNHYSFHNGKLCAIPKTEEKQIKSEAYKEFAERLHQNCEKYPYTLPSVLANIEITYKELTEGGNEDGMD